MRNFDRDHYQQEWRQQQRSSRNARFLFLLLGLVGIWLVAGLALLGFLR
jgi:Tfp pilus assembly protein PilN